MASQSTNTFTVAGKVERVDTFNTKGGKEIVTLILSVDGKYPQLVPIKAFGRLADEAKAFSRGDIIEASGRLGGRDYNGKVYGDVVGERFDIISAAGKQRELPAGRSDAPPPSDDDVPF